MKGLWSGGFSTHHSGGLPRTRGYRHSGSPRDPRTHTYPRSYRAQSHMDLEGERDIKGEGGGEGVERESEPGQRELRTAILLFNNQDNETETERKRGRLERDQDRARYN